MGANRSPLVVMGKMGQIVTWSTGNSSTRLCFAFFHLHMSLMCHVFIFIVVLM